MCPLIIHLMIAAIILRPTHKHVGILRSSCKTIKLHDLHSETQVIPGVTIVCTLPETTITTYIQSAVIEAHEMLVGMDIRISAIVINPIGNGMPGKAAINGLKDINASNIYPVDINRRDGNCQIIPALAACTAAIRIATKDIRSSGTGYESVTIICGS